MYKLLYHAAATAALPLALAAAATQPKHRAILQRVRPWAPRLGSKPLWVHACSVGEVAAARTFIRAAAGRWPATPIVLTTSTAAGRARAAEVQGATAAWCPLDHWWIVRGFIERLRPAAVLLVETEIWPALIWEASRRGAPVWIVNGRISDKHWERCRRVRGLFEAALAHVAGAVVQNAVYAERFRALGVPAERVHVAGSAKFDGAVFACEKSGVEKLRDELGWRRGEWVVVFGSTRPGDEELAASCWGELSKSGVQMRLVLAPRHLERAEEAAAAFQGAAACLSDIRRGRRPAGAAVVVADTLGELLQFYALADVAVVGGSFFPGVNGHNPVEPAALGVPTVFGPYMSNFRDAADALISAGGALQVESAGALPRALGSLLDDPAQRGSLGGRGQETVRANQGAVARTLDILAPSIAAGSEGKRNDAGR